MKNPLKKANELFGEDVNNTNQDLSFKLENRKSLYKKYKRKGLDLKEIIEKMEIKENDILEVMYDNKKILGKYIKYDDEYCNGLIVIKEKNSSSNTLLFTSLIKNIEIVNKYNILKKKGLKYKEIIKRMKINKGDKLKIFFNNKEINGIYNKITNNAIILGEDQTQIKIKFNLIKDIIRY